MASEAEVTKSLQTESSLVSVNGEGEMEMEEDFTDPKTIRAPDSLRDLITQLHKVFAKDKINVDYVKVLMESYTSNPRDWKKFAKFDPHRYTRNLVDEGNGKFNLMILCWNEAQGSSIHSHAGSHCFLKAYMKLVDIETGNLWEAKGKMIQANQQPTNLHLHKAATPLSDKKVLNGVIKEEMFEWPDHLLTSHQQTGRTEVEGEEGAEMSAQEEFTFYQNQCTYICDDLGLHRVENPSHVDKAVTLHLYSPPYDECLCFDQRTGRHMTSSVTFWSKFGKRTPFGKDPTLAAQQENN